MSKINVNEREVGHGFVGPVPSSWNVIRVKHLTRLYAGGTPDRDNPEYWDDGTIPWLNSGAVNQWIIKEPSAYITDEGFNNSSARWIPKGALVMALAGQGKTKGMVAQLAIDSTCNQSMAALVPTQKVDPRFLLWWLNANYETIRNLAGGEQRDGLNLEIVGDVPCPIPSLIIQRSIADYLDSETIRLDRLLQAKEKQLELLAEKRKSLISFVVLRGLSPNVPLQDSGILWIGKVPKNWKLEYAKWLFWERDDRSETGEEELLSVSHLTGVTPRSEKDVNMFEAETNEGYKLCKKDDLVINTLWAWMGAMGVSPIDGMVSPAYNVYQPRPEIDPAYIDAIVRIPIFAQEVTRYSKGIWSSRLRLYPEGFYEVVLPVPPIDEQREIIAHIKKETLKIDSLIAATERTISLLQERREVLIAAAVTGKLKVF